jgi:2-polyprenyl-6-methoxyphenol hydroxylase-like FAD-dependent oxidoreductase
MPFDRASTMWQLSFPADEAAALALAGRGDALKERALQVCAGWHAPLRHLLAATDPRMVSGHPAYDRDPLRSSYDCHRAAAAGTGDTAAGLPPRRSRVTLMGDAAHPMSPFKAQGANQALLDALSLSRALLSSELARPGRRPVAEALREYEDEMASRSAVKVLKSRAAAEQLHSPAALTVGNVTRAHAAAEGEATNATHPSKEGGR